MNRTVRTSLPIALTAAAAGATAVALLLPGSAGAASSYPPATFQMYANVDSTATWRNVGAVSAIHIPGATGCQVTFSKLIGHCAAVAQPGKAGGNAEVEPAEPTVVYGGSNYATSKSWYVQFAQPDGQALDLIDDPFMMIVTCKK